MKDIEGLLRPQVRELKAYHVEEPDLPVKLHANESPFNLSEGVREEIAREVSELQFNRYPAPGCDELRNELAKSLGVGTDQIVIGNGSDELIQMIIMAFGGHNAPVVIPHPTFSMYRNIALAMGEEVKAVTLNSTFDLDLPSMVQAVQSAPSITFLSYPNNPTGNCFSAEKIEEILRSSEGIVVVDEAYFDYSKKSFLDRLDEFPNLIVLRTLSKIGLASLRLGFLIAPPLVADVIDRVRLPYNITAISQMAALTALNRREEIGRSIEAVIGERKRLIDELERIDSVDLFRSDSNFILFRVPESDKLFQFLIDQGVLIRSLNSPGPLENCLRVTVGLPEENNAFLKALKST